MKTLAELEAESSDGFRNPVRTAEQEARSAQIRQAKREYEAANTPTETTDEREDEQQ